ncbi:hypothetical protein VNI00_014802 [Paramarasmius palmivorus]|uniref:Uncharacterized protein n=1 Tax=Paramarasmius palmivorus TaxID=297713 RepID=A0AAW0BQE7_9AGAR
MSKQTEHAVAINDENSTSTSNPTLSSSTNVLYHATPPSEPSDASDSIGDDFIDVVNHLVAERLKFLTTDALLPVFMDEINAVTREGSQARIVWSNHASQLSEMCLEEDTSAGSNKWPEICAPPLHLSRDDGFIFRAQASRKEVTVMNEPSNGNSRKQQEEDDTTMEEAVDTGTNLSPAVVAAYHEVSVPIATVDFSAGGFDVQYINDFTAFLLHVSDGAPPRPPWWSAVVYRWVDQEETWELARVPKKPVCKKPRCAGIQEWNQSGRFRPTSLKPPKTATLTDLCDTWWIWWSTSNPDWRTYVDDFVVSGGDGDWSDMELAGKDGLVLHLVALRWWHDCGGESDNAGMWLEAVKSFYDTLGCLHTHTTTKYREALTDARKKKGLKRKPEPLENSTKKKKCAC